MKVPIKVIEHKHDPPNLLDQQLNVLRNLKKKSNRYDIE
jgi:hypothetical protein